MSLGIAITHDIYVKKGQDVRIKEIIGGSQEMAAIKLMSIHLGDAVNIKIDIIAGRHLGFCSF